MGFVTYIHKINFSYFLLYFIYILVEDYHITRCKREKPILLRSLSQGDSFGEVCFFSE